MTSSRRRGAWRAPAARAAHLLVVLFVVTIAASLLIELTPGDVGRSIAGESASEADVQAIRANLGLDKAVVERYIDWVGNAIRGDLGESYQSRQPVVEAIRDRLPITLELAVLAMVTSLAISIPLAIYCAYREGRAVDRLVSLLCSMALSSPVFLTALLLVYLLSIRFDIFPVTGWVPMTEDPFQNLRHVALPVAALAAYQVPTFTRVLRFDLSSTLREDFMLVARSKGLPPRYLLFRHALRPSALSLVTVAGVATGHLIGGSIIIETLFSLPGIGAYLVKAIFARDYVVVQGAVLLIGVAYVAVNVVVDAAYAWLDPRTRTN